MSAPARTMTAPGGGGGASASRPQAPNGAGAVPLAYDMFVVIRALGMSMSGRVEALVESEPFDTLEGAIGCLQQGVALGSGFISGDTSGRGRRLNAYARGRGRPSSALAELRRSRGATYELPVNTQVWHVAGAPQRGNSDARYMVVRLIDLKGNLLTEPYGISNGGRGAGANAGGAPNRELAVNARNALPTTSIRSQVADGLPFVDAKTFGARSDPYILRPNISKAAFRALLVRAIGENLADDREIYPVLDKSDVQLQVANSVQYHVLAIRAPGHAPGDFYMAVDDQGRAYVRADQAKSVQEKSKHGRSFELLCQFPSLVQLKTCRCIYQEGVLYIIVFPRTAKVRPLKLSATNPAGEKSSAQQSGDAIVDPAVLAANVLDTEQGGSGDKRKLEDWESEDDEPVTKTANVAVEGSG